MLNKFFLSVLFCMISAVAALPCMGDDGGSGGSIGDFVSGIGGGIGDVVSGVGSGIASGASTIGSGIGDVVSSVGSGLVDGASIVGSGVSTIVGGVGDLVSGIGSGAASGDLVSMPDLLGASGDLTSNLTDGLGNLLASASGLTSIPSIGNLGNAGDFPVVGPNIGYKRMLWLFSGESSITSIKALFNGVVSGIQDISGTLKEGLNQFTNQ
jgi:hypothetical protein